MSNKSLARCIFDLVNSKNPSGGMIGTGNCQWFHNIVLRLMDTVGEDLQKLLKNHAVVHDACGFMLLHNDIGPGYVFGLFPHNVINFSSAGALRSRIGHWISMISAMGQVLGLTAMYYLMKHLTAPFFKDYDDQHSREHCIKDNEFRNLGQNGRLTRLRNRFYVFIKINSIWHTFTI